jgi:hypothetical protein
MGRPIRIIRRTPRSSLPLAIPRYPTLAALPISFFLHARPGKPQHGAGPGGQWCVPCPVVRARHHHPLARPSNVAIIIQAQAAQPVEGTPDSSRHSPQAANEAPTWSDPPPRAGLGGGLGFGNITTAGHAVLCPLPSTFQNASNKQR